MKYEVLKTNMIKKTEVYVQTLQTLKLYNQKNKAEEVP